MTLLCLALLLPSAPAPLQSVGGNSVTIYQWDGGADSDRKGNAVSNAGDVNADGIPDLVIGTNWADPGGLADAGTVIVRSGADGTVLHKWNGASAGDNFGDSVSTAGDVDADGYDDIIIGATGANFFTYTSAGSAYVFSGSTGSLLYQWGGSADYKNFGGAVDCAGDVDGDGYDDVIIGDSASNLGGLAVSGSAFIYSGYDGSLIFRVDGDASYDYLGNSLAGAGDINADGYDDVIIGTLQASPGGLLAAGSAYAYSGYDGSLLYQWDGAAESDYLGRAVSGAGDLNQDGYADVIVCALGANPGGLTNAGSVFAFSGKTGSLIHRWDGDFSNDWFGSSVASAGDVNGDLYPDVIIGSVVDNFGGTSNTGTSGIYSGIDGYLLHQWGGEAAGDYFGVSVSGAGDINGDSFADVIVGAERASPSGINEAGSVYVFSVHPFLRPNTFAISASSGGVLNLDLHFPADARFDNYKILISQTGTGPTNYGVDVPLTLDSLVQRTFRGDYPVSVYSDLQGTLDIDGKASGSLTVPSGLPGSLIGSTFYFAAISSPPTSLPEYSSAVAAIRISP